MEKPELYFSRDIEWREWLDRNYNSTPQGVYLVFYKLATGIPTMRWEEAVRVALCYGWIDSTVKSVGGGKRRQYFCPRKPKAEWSALNKKHIEELEALGLIHQSGYESIEEAKKNGNWTALDDVENLVISENLKAAFLKHPKAFQNFNAFSPSYRKAYLRWLYNAKRPETKVKRLSEIISLCEANIKSRNTR